MPPNPGQKANFLLLTAFPFPDTRNTELLLGTKATYIYLNRTGNTRPLSPKSPRPKPLKLSHPTTTALAPLTHSRPLRVPWKFA